MKERKGKEGRNPRSHRKSGQGKKEGREEKSERKEGRRDPKSILDQAEELIAKSL